MNKSGVIMVVIFISIILITVSKSQTEAFTDVSATSVLALYQSDTQAVSVLTRAAQSVQNGTLRVPSDLNLLGPNLEIANKQGLGTTILTTRRALSHEAGDKLVINSSGDYTGGVTINNLNCQGKAKENGVPLVPRGLVTMWTDSTAPSGWAFCDGGTYTWNGKTTVTPDLRGRFSRMYSESTDDVGWGGYFKPIATDSSDDSHLGLKTTDKRSLIISNLKVGNKGGSDLVFLSVNEIPAHTHKSTEHPINYNNNDQTYLTNATAAGSKPKDNMISNGSGSARITDAAGGTTGHNNTPPFHVVSFIMKL